MSVIKIPVTIHALEQVSGVFIPRSMQAHFDLSPEIQDQILARVHAWMDAHAKSHDEGDTKMAARVEALEKELAKLQVYQAVHGVWPAEPAHVAAAKPGCFSDWHRDMATNRACGACDHQTACKAETDPQDQPAGDDAAVDELRCWSVGYEYYHDAYFSEDAPFANQQPTADALAVALQHGARLVPRAVRHKDNQVTDLRAKLVEAERMYQTQFDLSAANARRADQIEAELNGHRAADTVDGMKEQRDKALAELATMTERAERREWINLENCESVKARLAGYLLTKELVAVERLDAEIGTSQHLSDIIASRDAAIMKLEKEIVEATRQKDICRLDAIKLRDMLEASKNGHWYGRMITAETQAVDLKQERDQARAELAEAVARQHKDCVRCLELDPPSDVSTLLVKARAELAEAVALLRDSRPQLAQFVGISASARLYEIDAFLAKQEKP